MAPPPPFAPPPPPPPLVSSAAPAPAVPPLPAPSLPHERVAPSGRGPIDTGVPGASARAEFEQRKAKRRREVEDRWGTGRIGRIAQRLTDDPQSTKSWSQGAAGEERVAQVLATRLGDRAVVLHDRRVPGTRGNIDHIAVASSGVWVIDAKRYRGKVECREVGGWFRTDLRLYVKGRDRTKLVDGMQWQRDAVVRALGGADVPVRCVLAVVGADWDLLQRPFTIDDVLVAWPKKLPKLIAALGRLDAAEVDRVAGLLAAALPPQRR